MLASILLLLTDCQYINYPTKNRRTSPGLNFFSSQKLDRNLIREYSNSLLEQSFLIHLMMHLLIGRYLIWMCLLVSLSSCMFHRLDVQTQYLSHENLASYSVKTPDPRLDNPVLGQRLLIQWCLPASELGDSAAMLYIRVLFKNHQEQELTVPIRRNTGTYVRGTYLFNVLNQDYFDTGGIMTYIVEIRSGNCVIESWRHPLWTELITFDFSQSELEEQPSSQ